MKTKYRIYSCVILSVLIVLLKIIKHDIYSWSFVSGTWVALISIAVLPSVFREKKNRD